MATRIQVRRGTTTQWNNADPTLNEGEFGYNTTLGQVKIGDGSTIWSELDYLVSDAALDTSLGNYIEDSDKGAISGVAGLDASRNILAPVGIIFEGTTDNEYETTLDVTDPTADRTITLPNVTGTVITTGNLSSITSVGTLESLTVTGDLTINGTTTTINSTTLTIDDKNIVLADGNTSDASADGGGITLSGATSKTFNWVDATDAWTSSEHMNLLTGKSYKINGTSISTALPALTWGEVKNGKSGLTIS
jgi:hypothetical protein